MTGCLFDGGAIRHHALFVTCDTRQCYATYMLMLLWLTRHGEAATFARGRNFARCTMATAEAVLDNAASDSALLVRRYAAGRGASACSSHRRGEERQKRGRGAATENVTGGEE